MHFDPNFVFTPLPPVADAPGDPLPPIPAMDEDFVAPLPNPYGPLLMLPGHWAGEGFNMIFRPILDPSVPQAHYLELNLTRETIDFAFIRGAIPNRGSLQPDIAMFGLTYLQQISDVNSSTPDHVVGLHAEPGVWAHVPPTSNPAEPATVVRMASIPHGTVINAQGIAVPQKGVPPFDPPPGGYPRAFNPKTHSEYISPTLDLRNDVPNRTPRALLDGIHQAMIDNPVSILTGIVQRQDIVSTVTLSVSTMPDRTVPDVTAGGGVANTAFLEGSSEVPNARVTEVDATFWIQLVREEGGYFRQLQYRQAVFLDFAGFLWPHVTVATLRKLSDQTPPV